MKIIDLLNKIANGEDLPSKIKIGGEQILILNDSKDNYLYEDNDEYYGKCLIHWFCLNEEVEILEEEKKIPEKINTFEELTQIPANFEFNDILLADKLNEIIDYLKSKGDE